MPSEDFVKKIQEAIRREREQRNLETLKQLHDAEVIKNEGSSTWEAFNAELREVVNQINLSFSDMPLNVCRDANKVLVRTKSSESCAIFDANTAKIYYSGPDLKGVFAAHVKGNALLYTDFDENSHTRRIDFSDDGWIGSAVSVQEMAEKMVEAVCK